MPDKNKNIIEASNLTKIYKMGREEIHAVAEVSVNIEQGKFYSFVGPSGSGKSTLLNLLGVLDSPSSGKLSINGETVFDTKNNGRISQKNLTAIRRKYFGFIFQSFYLLPTLNVKENISLPLLFARKKADPEHLNKILQKLGLQDRGGHLPSQLSGGEMQRVAIGRSLVANPQIIIADEPTGNLDSKNAVLVFEVFKKLSEEGITVLTATHDLQLAEQFSDKIVRLKDGKITTEAQSC
jgi:putative ABC transport system ATP-binding protein